MTLEELESTWASLQLPRMQDGINGRRAIGLPSGRSVYLAVDGRGRRHLLVQIPEDTAPVVQRETRSLEVVTDRFAIGDNPESLYVDLVCTDPAQNHTFSAISQDLIRSVRGTAGGLRDSIVNSLARWRAFWTVKSGGMTRQDAIGLFGELWFLRRWLGPASGAVVNHWQATESARHDFQGKDASVEVKTALTQSPGPPIHRISSLEKLTDPENGDLYLFSLQVCDDAIASNTLHRLVSSLTSDLEADFQALADLNDKLATRGYSPADQQAPAMHLRILAERLYRVDDTLPRLTRSRFEPAGLPVGIVGVEYHLDLAACDACLVATVPTGIPPRMLASLR